MLDLRVINLVVMGLDGEFKVYFHNNCNLGKEVVDVLDNGWTRFVIPKVLPAQEFRAFDLVGLSWRLKSTILISGVVIDWDLYLL